MNERTAAAQNQRIATALGWTGLYDTRWADESGTMTYAVCGTNSDGLQDCIMPDYCADLNASIGAIRARDPMIQVVIRFNVYEQKPECELVLQGLGLEDRIRIPAYAYGDTDAGAVANCLEKWLMAKGRP